MRVQLFYSCLTITLHVVYIFICLLTDFTVVVQLCLNSRLQSFLQLFGPDGPGRSGQAGRGRSGQGAPGEDEKTNLPREPLGR